MGTVDYLLDTHTLLWLTCTSYKLGDDAKKAINDVNSRFFASSASAYEIMNKYRIGKLPEFEYVAKNYTEVLKKLGVHELPINTAHSYYAGNFEWTHRDPFDRILAAQAHIENLTLITNDSIFQELSWVNTLW